MIATWLEAPSTSRTSSSRPSAERLSNCALPASSLPTDPMYRALRPSRVHVTSAVATCPPGSTRRSRIRSLPLASGKRGTMQMVSSAFKPSPATSVVPIGGFTEFLVCLSIEQLDYIEEALGEALREFAGLSALIERRYS